jgi:Secretion system C-terminal sorting domain/Right handed beta helix region
VRLCTLLSQQVTKNYFGKLFAKSSNTIINNPHCCQLLLFMKYVFTAALLFLTGGQTFATSVAASAYGYNATNATTAFRAAVNATADTTIIDFAPGSSGEWNVDASIFFNLVNKTIIFEPGVKLIATPGYTQDGNLFRIRYCNTVKVIGNNTLFKMQKPEYTTGEFRHCIAIVDCDNIEISNIIAADSGGDGIFIAAFGPTKFYCENIVLRNMVCDNNRRQGISVITVKNLLVEHCIFKNTNGTLPEAGVDFEPDQNYERLENIVFKKCSFTNNYGNGVALALINLNNTSQPVDIIFNDCYISQNHQPSNVYAASEINATSPETNFPTGSVTFNRCLIENSQWSAITVRKAANSYGINFNDCVFKNISQSQVNFNNPIWLETLSYNPVPNAAFGGVNFNNQLIEFSSNMAFLQAYGSASSAGLANVSGNITVINPAVNTPPVYVNLNSQANVGYTYNFASGLPASIVNVTDITTDFYEANCNKNIFTYSRNSTTNNFPLAVLFTITGAATTVADYLHIPSFAIIPSGVSNINDTIIAINDGITEPDESVNLTTGAGSNYTVGNGNFSKLLFNGACNVVLPVKFISVQVSKQSNTHILRFTVANEADNTLYEIERSADGSNFETIGAKKVVTSVGNATHFFGDTKPLGGKNYYRVKQIENGKFYFSVIVSIAASDEVFVIYPNPVDKTIFYFTPPARIKNIQVFNGKGQLVKTIVPVQNSINVEKLPQGMYVVKVYFSNGEIKTQSFIKL